MRWFDREPHPLVVGLQAAPGIGVGVGLGFGLAASLTGVARRKIAVALLGAALSLVSIRFGGRVARSKPRRTRPIDEPYLRVLSANLLDQNSSFYRVAEAIRSHDADVVVTIETTATWMEQLELRWQIQPVARAPGGSVDDTEVVIWSALPAATASLPVGRAEFPLARFETTGGPVTVVGVHIQSPARRSGLHLWKEQLSALTNWARSQHESFVLAGDFNAGRGNPSMRSLCASATDAALRASQPAASTFPATTFPFGSLPLPFRLMDLDHVLVSGSIDVAAFGTGTVHGSDHDLVWADIAVRSPTEDGSGTTATTTGTRTR